MTIVSRFVNFKQSKNYSKVKKFNSLNIGQHKLQCATSKDSVTPCNLCRNFVASKMQHVSQSSTFLFQEALREVESGSTFRNDCRNVAMHFLAIAQWIIPLATCLAIIDPSLSIDCETSCKKRCVMKLQFFK